MGTVDILSLFEKTGALLEGHFQLTSGLHSARYIQCARVLQYPGHAEVICGEIAAHFRPQQIDVVLSPAFGGIVVGQEVGRQLGVRTMFTERSNSMMQLRRGFEVARDEKVLVCEDVITTGGSVHEVCGIVKRAGGLVIGVGAVIDRSGGRHSLNNFFAAVALDIETYDPKECPLCQQGIPVVKPGSRLNHPSIDQSTGRVGP
jgi:orotate phosphoribosyltransferase